MLQENEIISVVIPTYNRQDFITETIQSLQAQTYPYWECIIVDDGSTDHTKDILAEAITRDNRIRYFQIINSGPSTARALGLTKATGEFIQFLDSDDLIPPSRFQKCLSELGEADFIVTNFDRFKKANEPYLPPYCVLSQDILNLNSIALEWDESFTIPIHCGFFRAAIFHKISLREFLQIKEDWVMWVEIFLHGYHAKFLDENLAHYRFSHDSLSYKFDIIPKNAALAYEHVYGLLPAHLKADFFKVITNRLCRQLGDNYEIQKSNAHPDPSFIRTFFRRIKKVIKAIGT